MRVRRTWLIEAREKLGLSQPKLAPLIGCSQNELSKIETGERQRPKPRYVEALARVLHMTRDEVLYGNPQPHVVRILGEIQGDEMIRPVPDDERLELEGFTPDIETDGYRVAVSTLEPRYKLGDILLCSRNGTPIQGCIGRECIVEIDGKKYVGLVEEGASPRILTVRPSSRANPLLIDRTPTWVAPILAIAHQKPQDSPGKEG